ncbi:MAG: hypothetical protein KatS3mg111_1954 [Pirellulaceae bacterium]|nr:MAG: hypothetical protein KatS3mg111_1954 [Pirellulaceae bacterium]
MHRRLHESTSRGLCRATIVLLAIVPLVATLAFSAWIHLPLYRQQAQKYWERQFASALGAITKVSGLRREAPGSTYLEELQFYHPESGEPLGSAHGLHVVRRGDQWLLHIDHMEMEASKLASAWWVMEPYVLRRPAQVAVASLKVERVRIADTTSRTSTELTDLRIAFLPDATASRLSVEWQWAARSDDSRSSPGTPDSQHPSPRVNIKRLHKEEGLPTLIQLRTGATPLPCSMLASFWPSVRTLGRNATVEGIIDWRADHGRWQLLVNRDERAAAETAPHQAGGLLIRNIDYARLPWQQDLAMTGQGWVWLSQARIEGGSIQLLRGAIQSGPGRISHGLLTLCHSHLGLQLAPGIATSNVPILPYDQALVHFQIAPATFQIAGAMEGGAAIVDRNGPLAQRPDWHTPLPLQLLAGALDTVLAPSLSDHPAEKDRLLRMASSWLPLER